MIYKHILIACLSTVILWCAPVAGVNVLVGEWPVVGQDYGNHQAPESSINSTNAATLLANQNFFFPTSGYMSGQPAIASGVAYFADYAGYVYAVNTRTGALIWKTDNLQTEFANTPAITDKYIYIAGGNLFNTFPGLPVKIFCIKRSDGSIVWSKPVTPQSGTTSGVNDYTSDVTVVDDLVIFGVANTENVYADTHDYKARGAVVAYNRFDGSNKWKFYTTSDQNAAHPQYGGGAGVWSSPGVDLNRGILFIGVGQNFETPTSPYEDSLLALDYKTGELIGYSQMTINDIWSPKTSPTGSDWDVDTHPNLFSINIPGKGKVDFVGVADKSGKYYILKRDSFNSDKPKILVTLYLDSGSRAGAIQSTPAIDEVNGIMYIASDAIPNSSNPNIRVTMDASSLSCPPDPTANLYCSQALIVPKVSAFDLNKLVQGLSQADSLLWENKDSTATNHGETFGPITLTNDVIILANGNGGIRILKRSDGTQIAEVLPLGPGAPILGGVTVVGNKIFVPTLGGLVSYKIP
jgi:outer membrane protein assembly factor BamB